MTAITPSRLGLPSIRTGHRREVRRPTLGTSDYVSSPGRHNACYISDTDRHHDLAGEMLGSLLLGLLGFPAGFALWILYRLVYFVASFTVRRTHAIYLVGEAGGLFWLRSCR